MKILEVDSSDGVLPLNVVKELSGDTDIFSDATDPELLSLHWVETLDNGELVGVFGGVVTSAMLPLSLSRGVECRLGSNLDACTPVNTHILHI